MPVYQMTNNEACWSTMQSEPTLTKMAAEWLSYKRATVTSSNWRIEIASLSRQVSIRFLFSSLLRSAVPSVQDEEANLAVVVQVWI